MAASETVRLRLQFEYPPPATPHCTAFWLLVDLNRCRVVTDLISLIVDQTWRNPDGHGQAHFLSCYFDRVKLEEKRVAESSVLVSNGDGTFSPKKARKRAFKVEEDEETELDYRYSKKQWKRQENSDCNEKALDLAPKAVTDQTVRRKKKRKNKATCAVVDEDEETKRKSPKKKEKCEYKKKTKNPKSSKVQAVKEWPSHSCSPPKSSARNSIRKVRRQGVSTCSKDSPISSSDSESSHESTSDGISNVTLDIRNSSEKIAMELSKEGPSTKNTTANKLATKAGFSFTPSKGKTSGTSSSSSDSCSESDDQRMSQSTAECAAGFLKTVSLFAGRGCPGPGLSLQTPSAVGWNHSDSNTGRQAPGPLPSVGLLTGLGRGWSREEDFLSWKGARGRGMRGRGRGRGRPVFCAVNRNTECQRQQQLNETVTNISTIIQNPVETQKKDYSLLPKLAAPPQIGEKIAFKLLELTSDYSPDVSDYKEGKILSHNPETEQVDIEILSSLPALKEPGKFDLVYHNENGTEVVEYAVTQERRITTSWKELIDPRLIIESPSNTSNTDLV
ncbi:coilin [Carlito syrichta]|uniref:Coilin n=1 Tax=Carlito syrichta TaxID=1868482 RepID=A0A3Q0DHL6_CARSF|nr:coilin [Carlito syrichta]